mgnify:CR=1 FL=1
MTDFEAVYARHFDSVYRYVYSLCRDEHTAEEITQEAFYRAMTHMDTFDGKCRLYVWLCQIAKNTYFTYAKRQKRHTELEEDAALPGVEGQLLERETAWAGRAVQGGVLPAGVRGAVIFSDRAAVRQVGQLGAVDILPGKNGVKEAGR